MSWIDSLKWIGSDNVFIKGMSQSSMTSLLSWLLSFCFAQNVRFFLYILDAGCALLISDAVHLEQHSIHSAQRDDALLQSRNPSSAIAAVKWNFTYLNLLNLILIWKYFPSRAGISLFIVIKPLSITWAAMPPVRPLPGGITAFYGLLRWCCITH